MPTNQIRRELLNRIKASNFPGSIVEVFQAADQGIDLISQFEQQQMQEQQMQVANTPQEQEIGLREQHAMGNTQASMAFPNVQPGQSFNTVGMKAPINIDKVDEQGHLVESYKNVPPGIQDLPTGPYKGTVIESPAGYQTGGVKKSNSKALDADGNLDVSKVKYWNDEQLLKFYEANKGDYLKGIWSPTPERIRDKIHFLENDLMWNYFTSPILNAVNWVSEGTVDMMSSPENLALGVLTGAAGNKLLSANPIASRLSGVKLDSKGNPIMVYDSKKKEWIMSNQRREVNKLRNAVAGRTADAELFKSQIATYRKNAELNKYYLDLIEKQPDLGADDLLSAIEHYISTGSSKLGIVGGPTKKQLERSLKKNLDGIERSTSSLNKFKSVTKTDEFYNKQLDNIIKGRNQDIKLITEHKKSGTLDRLFNTPYHNTPTQDPADLLYIDDVIDNSWYKTLKKTGGLKKKYQKGGPNIDPLTTNIVAPDPVNKDLMKYSLNFECDTDSGRGCGDPTGSLFRLGLKGGLDFTKGFSGQPKNLGPGWQDGALVDNRIGTYSNPNVDANIGGYLRTNLPFHDKNWNPAHIDIGYNYNKPLELDSSFSRGSGTHNITGKIARSGDHFAGSPGYGGIFGNKGGTSRPQYSYGIEGNYDLTNKKLTNLGAYGQIGIMGPVNVSGSAGYNFETGKPQFGLGFGARFKKGGVKKYQYGGGSGLGLNTALEFGNRGGRLFASPTYRMGNLDVGGIIGSHSTPQKGQDYWNSHGFAGGNFNLRFGNSGRNLRDYDTRFMGSLQGELGKGWTQHQNDNNMNLSARIADPSGWNNEPPVEDPITQSSSNNFKMPLDASARLNLGVGRPGAAGCFGGMCYTAPVLPWNISAFGEYGTKQSLRPNFNVGLSGRYGPVTGEYSYNVNTKQPGFKVGLNIPLFNQKR